MELNQVATGIVEKCNHTVTCASWCLPKLDPHRSRSFVLLLKIANARNHNRPPGVVNSLLECLAMGSASSNGVRRALPASAPHP
jgi:hypothetical protein